MPTETEQCRHFSDGFELLADALLEVLLLSKTFLKERLLELLSFYETSQTQEAVEKKTGDFLKISKRDYERLKSSYVPYRIFSRRIEKPEEEPEMQYSGICGELFLFRFLAFLIFQKTGKLSKEEWKQVICLTYRLTAHEKKIGEELLNFFGNRSEEIKKLI